MPTQAMKAMSFMTESMPVRSIITSPANGGKLVAGTRDVALRGAAWAGDLAVRDVHVSLDFGATWQRMQVARPRNRYDWQRWTHNVALPSDGYFELWVRATDSTGKAQPIVAAIDGICAGAGAMIACGSDIRYGTARSKVAFLFVRVGLAGADMGACSLLPRIIGQGRASDLLYTGRSMGGEEAERFGFYNAIHEPEKVLTAAQEMARNLADGPTFAHGMTKKLLHQEWNMGLDEAIEAEAEGQAICMQTQDFHTLQRLHKRVRHETAPTHFR